ncbi:hypothetical protein EVAR_32469_1 [Eumeta japonica]|uniref:Uncharacterized protein n=1 Tax=Eumeta variegata TaxID=151549 RepID=A0A4C1VP37_EUMVA|nr:hypothetical protein EVAR_32469_1 [Eumeta japonica]
MRRLSVVGERPLMHGKRRSTVDTTKESNNKPGDGDTKFQVICTSIATLQGSNDLMTKKNDGRSAGIGGPIA